MSLKKSARSLMEMAKIILLSCKDNNFYNFRSELILEMHKLYDVVLVCPYGPKIDYFTQKGIRFIDVPMDRRGKNVFKDLKLIKNYKQLLKKEMPDIVLTFTGKSSFYGALACKRLSVPCIVNNAGYADSGLLLNSLFKFLYRYCENKADCIMFQNSYERDCTEKLLKWKVPYRDIPGSGVNINKFTYQEYPHSDDIVVFNYVARIVKLKGIEEFLECAKVIKSRFSNVEFRVFGEFDDDKYREIIAEYEKEGILKYFGSQLDMIPWIKECHAVIHPSYYEGMTNVLLEHSSCGRPCLGSNVAGVKDAIDEGETGFVFNVKDVDSMVSAVEHFLTLSHDEKKQLGLNARQKMIRDFDRTIVTNTYLDEINHLLTLKNKG